MPITDWYLVGIVHSGIIQVLLQYSRNLVVGGIRVQPRLSGTVVRRNEVVVLHGVYKSRVYDSRHLQVDCQEPGSAPEPYAR